jgi:hypothetical protein
MLINTTKNKEYPIWRYAVLFSELEGKLNVLTAKYPMNMRVEKIGTSNEGRDIFLVILAEDITDKGIQAYEDFRYRALWQPEQIIDDVRNGIDYKIPLFFNCNLHGSEISGTDGMLAFIEEMLGSPQKSVLKDTVILINICANPDGRCRGLDILNSHGFDLNRDFTAQTQPETNAIIRGIITRFYPSIMVDFHGYMSSANILIDTCTPPHNPNTEYDLLENHLLKNAQKMADVIYQRLRLKTDIPALIWKDGWEDYGSVYTPSFCHYFGCIAHTLETNFPNEEGAAVTLCAAVGSLQYAIENKSELLINQSNYFLRGIKKESKDFHIPEFFVIPYNWTLHRDREIIRDTMTKLIQNGIKVFQSKLTESFVIPTAQPLRGLINNLLWQGENITNIIENMYDVSFHSYPVMRGFEIIEKDSLADEEEIIEVRKIEKLQGQLIKDIHKSYYCFSSAYNISMKFTNYLMNNGVEVYRAIQCFDSGESGDFFFKNIDHDGLTEEFLKSHDITVVPMDLPEQASKIKRQKILIVADSAGAYEVLLDWGFDVTFLPFSELNRGYQIRPELYDIFIFGGTKLGIWSDAYDETLGVGYGNSFALRERGREEVIEASRKFANSILFGYAGVKLNDIIRFIETNQPNTSFIDQKDQEDHEAGEQEEAYADWHLNTANGSFKMILDDADPLCFGYGPEQTVYVVGPMALEEMPGINVPVHFADRTFLNGWCKSQDEFNGKPAALYKKSPQGTTVLLGFDPCFRRYVDSTFRIMANAIFLTGY